MAQPDKRSGPVSTNGRVLTKDLFVDDQRRIDDMTGVNSRLTPKDASLTSDERILAGFGKKQQLKVGFCQSARNV